MKMSDSRFMSRQEVDGLLRLSGEYHRGERGLPHDILAKKEEIVAATRNAHLFMVRTGGVIDYGMVDEVVHLKRELDGMYGGWVQDETKGVI